MGKKYIKQTFFQFSAAGLRKWYKEREAELKHKKIEYAKSLQSYGNLLAGDIYDLVCQNSFITKEAIVRNLLTKTDGTALLTAEQANALNGYLHMRFYRDELNDAGHYGNPQHTKENKDADGNVTGTLPYVAYGYTTAYPRDAYMGLFISELHFYARSWTQDGDETKTPRITAMTVVLTVAKRDANNLTVPLCTQKAIVQLPGEPVILYEPGTWDGKASSES